MITALEFIGMWACIFALRWWWIHRKDIVLKQRKRWWK